MARPPDAARSPDSPLLPRPSSPLLRLSPQIRQRIYRHLGLASWDGRPGRFYLHAGRLKLRHGRGEYELRFVPDPSCFHGLLLSCRTIHAEATALLYSANQFILYYVEPLGDSADQGSRTSLRRPLHTLHTLTSSSFRSLSNLKIIVNQAACHQLTLYDYARICCLQDHHRHSSLSRCRKKHGGLHQLPLLSPASEGDDNDRLAAAYAVMQEWHSAAARLFSHVTPGRLVLSLVCDIDPQHPQAMDVAESAVAPIRLLTQHHLKECHIRLAKTTDSRLQRLAQDTVSHACGISITPSMRLPSKGGTAALLNLPRELRIRILEYTDLVTPRREVTWGRQEHAYFAWYVRRDPDDDPDECHSNNFSECWYDRSYDGGPPTHGCFCHRRHAAFSPTCHCWAPPGPTLFLICRVLHEDAQFVFFSGNRFIVHDYKPCPPWAVPVPELEQGQHEDGAVPLSCSPYPNERFAASEFLRDIVPTHSLAHLRFLELVFPPYRPPTWPQRHHPAVQDWWSTVDWLRDKINLPALTLRLFVMDIDSDQAARAYYRTITSDEGGLVMTAYMNLLRPLARLGESGLARFYAQLPHPWELTEETKARELDDVEWARRETLAIKERAERYVMGDRYESLYADGREEPKRSDWWVIYA